MCSKQKANEKTLKVRIIENELSSRSIMSCLVMWGVIAGTLILALLTAEADALHLTVKQVCTPTINVIPKF